MLHFNHRPSTLFHCIVKKPQLSNAVSSLTKQSIRRVSNLMFYAQSTVSIIQNRSKEPIYLNRRYNQMSTITQSFYLGLWWCTIKLNVVAKGSAIQKIACRDSHILIILALTVTSTLKTANKKIIFLHDIPACGDASPHLIWSQKFQLRQKSMKQKFKVDENSSNKIIKQLRWTPKPIWHENTVILECLALTCKYLKHNCLIVVGNEVINNIHKKQHIQKGQV